MDAFCYGFRKGQSGVMRPVRKGCQSGHRARMPACPPHPCPEPGLGPIPLPRDHVPAASHKFWSPIHSRMGPTQKTLLSSGFLKPLLLPGGHGPFYSDYAALQRRLLNFSPPWSLIFTNRGTTAILRIAQPEF